MGVGWTDFVASLVGSLAWPVAAVVLVALLRRDLSGILRRMSHGRIRWPGGEADFVLEIEKVRRDAEAASSAIASPEASSTSQESSEILARLRQDLLSTARVAPVAAVESAWRLLETGLRDVVHDAGALMGVRSSTPGAWAGFLASHGALGEDAPRVVAALNSIRDRALHQQYVDSEDVAVRFVDACLYLYDDLLRVDVDAIRRSGHGAP